MNERARTALLAVGALALFYLMFVSDDLVAPPRQTHPTSAERGPDGYYALTQWLRRSGVHTLALRERYAWLNESGNLRSARGNVLLVTLPAQRAFRTEELAALDRWLRAGNTLLVMAALCDQPDWAHARASNDSGVLRDLTGIEFETVAQREQRLHPQTLATDPVSRALRRQQHSIMLATPQQLVAQPIAAHPLFAGVQQLVALSDYVRSSWSARLPYESFMLQAARDRDTGEAVMWMRLLGNGRIWVSAYGSSLTNRVIAQGDNARWFANLLQQNLAPQGSVILDDLHQGVSAVYDGARFYADQRLWISVTVLLLLWFSWVLGATRLRTPRLHTPAPRAAELVRASGALLPRTLTPQAAALRLIELALPLRRRAAAAARVAPADMAALQRLENGARSGHRVSLRDVHNLMLRIDGQLR